MGPLRPLPPPQIPRTHPWPSPPPPPPSWKTPRPLGFSAKEGGGGEGPGVGGGAPRLHLPRKREISVLCFPGFGCATENFTKISRQKRCEKGKFHANFTLLGAALIKSLVICDSRFESQIAIAIKSRDLEHLGVYIWAAKARGRASSTASATCFAAFTTSSLRGSLQKLTVEFSEVGAI